VRAPTASGQGKTTASEQGKTTASGQGKTTASEQGKTTASGQDKTHCVRAIRGRGIVGVICLGSQAKMAMRTLSLPVKKSHKAAFLGAIKVGNLNYHLVISTLNTTLIWYFSCKKSKK